MWKKLTFDSADNANAMPMDFSFESADGVLRDGQVGFGSVRYAEGSVYTGSLIYVNGCYEKYGFGEQNFTFSCMSAADFNAPVTLVPYKFVGFYDYRVTEWILGNGVMYFKDAYGNPAAFIKGYFYAPDVRGNWRGKFTPELLLPGFTPDMEIKPFPPHYHRSEQLLNELSDGAKCNTVLIGDSWFEFYHTVYPQKFNADTAGKSVLDIGIGGSTYKQWNKYFLDNLLNKIEFERVIINLGFNDIHSHESPSAVANAAKKTVQAIRNHNADAQIYVLSISPSIHFKGFLSLEKRANDLLKRLCMQSRATYIDTVSLFMPDGEYVDGFDGLFVSDGLHLNLTGYELWTKKFVDLL